MYREIAEAFSGAHGQRNSTTETHEDWREVPRKQRFPFWDFGRDDRCQRLSRHVMGPFISDPCSALMFLNFFFFFMIHFFFTNCFIIYYFIISEFLFFMQILFVRLLELSCSFNFNLILICYIINTLFAVTWFI